MRAGNAYVVRCKECGAQTARSFMKDWHRNKYIAQGNAAEAWNRRADAGNEPLTLEELRKMDGEPSPGKYVVCWAKRNPFSGYMPMVAKVAANGFINPVTGLYITEIKNWAEIDMPDPPKED